MKVGNWQSLLYIAQQKDMPYSCACRTSQSDNFPLCGCVYFVILRITETHQHYQTFPAINCLKILFFVKYRQVLGKYFQWMP